MVAAGLVLGLIHKMDIHTQRQAVEWQREAESLSGHLLAEIDKIHTYRSKIGYENLEAEIYRETWRGTRNELAERNKLELKRIGDYTELIRSSLSLLKEDVKKAAWLINRRPWRADESVRLLETRKTAAEFLAKEENGKMPPKLSDVQRKQ